MGADFRERADFSGNREELLFAKATEIKIANVKFSQPHLVRFSQVDFSRCILVGADVREIDFHAVTWPECHTWFGKRKCIYEPIDSEPEDLENTYRQIRQSYEDRRNYPEAGDFYYGEMDLKRKAYSSWRRFPPFSLTWWYWVCSRYGQSPFQAGIVLMGLLALFNFAICVNVYVDSNAPIERAGFWTVLWAYTLKIVTFGTPVYFEPGSKLGDFWTTLARLLIPPQAALFFLAVNRKFKR